MPPGIWRGLCKKWRTGKEGGGGGYKLSKKSNKKKKKKFGWWKPWTAPMTRRIDVYIKSKHGQIGSNSPPSPAQGYILIKIFCMSVKWVHSFNPLTTFQSLFAFSLIYFPQDNYCGSLDFGFFWQALTTVNADVSVPNITPHKSNWSL